MTYLKANSNANNQTCTNWERTHCDLMSKSINSKNRELTTVDGFPSNKMTISQTYINMVLITFPDYNAPISMHGPD